LGTYDNGFSFGIFVLFWVHHDLVESSEIDCASLCGAVAPYGHGDVCLTALSIDTIFAERRRVRGYSPVWVSYD
jgi:hypothetical protein